MGNLEQLVALRLSYNRLTGSLPSELGALKNLKLFRVLGNELTGTVPEELCQQVNVSALDLYLNCSNVACTCGCQCSVATFDVPPH